MKSRLPGARTNLKKVCALFFFLYLCASPTVPHSACSLLSQHQLYRQTACLQRIGHTSDPLLYGWSARGHTRQGQRQAREYDTELVCMRRSDRRHPRRQSTRGKFFVGCALAFRSSPRLSFCIHLTILAVCGLWAIGRGGSSKILKGRKPTSLSGLHLAIKPLDQRYWTVHKRRCSLRPSQGVQGSPSGKKRTVFMEQHCLAVAHHQEKWYGKRRPDLLTGKVASCFGCSPFMRNDASLEDSGRMSHQECRSESSFHASWSKKL